MNSQDRIYVRRCMRFAIAGVVLYLGISQIILNVHLGRLNHFLAGISGAAFFMELVSVGLLIARKMDEFQRVLLVRSFVWATVITMGFVTIWGFVDLYSHHTVFRFDLIWVPIILICVTAAAKVLIFRKHRSPDEENERPNVLSQGAGHDL